MNVDIISQYFSKFDLMLKKMRISFLEQLLPSKYYVQDLPFEIYARSTFLGYREELAWFNNRKGKISRDTVRWLSIELILRQVRKFEGGDYAELGTYQGKTARQIFRGMRLGAQLYCFDTFEGFDSKDLAMESSENLSISGAIVGAFGNTSANEVIRFVTSDNNVDRLVIRKGYFPETFAGLEDKKWAFVHLDCDLAAPMKAGLEKFWPGILPGGFLVIHDYNGYYANSIQPVVDNFLRNHNCHAVPLPDNGGSVVVVKPGN